MGARCVVGRHPERRAGGWLGHLDGSQCLQLRACSPAATAAAAAASA